MFHDRESTENAYKTLQEKGYTKDEINIVMSGDTLKKQFSGNHKHTEFGTYTIKNATYDSTIVSNDSTIADVIGSNGRSVIERGNVIILVGPISSGISGSGASGIPGGIIAALVDSGFSRASANIYEAGIKKGDIVLGVQIHNEEDAKYLKNDWRTNKVEEIHI
ncbi:hypothetical protein [Marivirga sp.]|uniref:hypothetical protein n=1 Tax=Marivirga sp. TaxID=2018662 RepID=UPI0025ECDD65|nr:hypothetical protein [Marivirga sp.]